MFLTALVIRRQGAIVRSFERAGATGSASARTAAELGLKPDMAWYQLVGRAVLRCPGAGRYYLDRPSWLRLRKRRRITGLWLAAVIVLLIVLWLWLRVKAA
ncbi:hypothetical protein ISN76_18015 [Dyella halodurans]|uniref:Uncharacterized protein n=1 Tax=Dyella halodurans TaxID=1920171 RepID=A0ABV9C7G6_9GAMM|nr:hypothetical protein [Dyella halodurans]